MSRLRTVAMLCLLVPASGCQRFDRVGECQAVARQANPVLASVEAERQKNPESPESYRKIAGEYDNLAQNLARLPVRTKRLAEALMEYQKMLHEAGRDARLFSDALASKDPARIAGARSAAQRTLKHESAALSRIDGTCRGK